MTQVVVGWVKLRHSAAAARDPSAVRAFATTRRTIARSAGVLACM
jgi:hypothetical protein